MWKTRGPQSGPLKSLKIKQDRLKKNWHLICHYSGYFPKPISKETWHHHSWHNSSGLCMVSHCMQPDVSILEFWMHHEHTSQVRFAITLSEAQPHPMKIAKEIQDLSLHTSCHGKGTHWHEHVLVHHGLTTDANLESILCMPIYIMASPLMFKRKFHSTPWHDSWPLTLLNDSENWFETIMKKLNDFFHTTNLGLHSLASLTHRWIIPEDWRINICRGFRPATRQHSNVPVFQIMKQLRLLALNKCKICWSDRRKELPLNQFPFAIINVWRRTVCCHITIRLFSKIISSNQLAFSQIRFNAHISRHFVRFIHMIERSKHVLLFIDITNSRPFRKI